MLRQLILSSRIASCSSDASSRHGTLGSGLQRVCPVDKLAIAPSLITPTIPFTDKQLRELRVKQRSTIEEIKKKTNYYSTKNLLERYDDGPAKVSSNP